MGDWMLLIKVLIESVEIKECRQIENLMLVNLQETLWNNLIFLHVLLTPHCLPHIDPTIYGA